MAICAKFDGRAPVDDGGITQALVAMARANAIEECAQAAEHVTPRHTECGNKIAAAIRAIDWKTNSSPAVLGKAPAVPEGVVDRETLARVVQLERELAEARATISRQTKYAEAVAQAVDSFTPSHVGEQSVLMQIAHIVMGFHNEDSAGHYNMLCDIEKLISSLPSSSAQQNPEQRHSGGVAELVDRQANDPSLWFAAQTAPEAYLQRALRELHAAIEGEVLSWKNPVSSGDNLPCGHHRSLLVESVESDYKFCDLCECRKRRNDAEQMERAHLRKIADFVNNNRSPKGLEVSPAVAAPSPLGGLTEIVAEYDGIVNGRLDPRDAEADFVMRGSDWREIRQALSSLPLEYLSNEQIEALSVECGWVEDRRAYMTDAESNIWCSRVRKLVAKWPRRASLSATRRIDGVDWCVLRDGCYQPGRCLEEKRCCHNSTESSARQKP